MIPYSRQTVTQDDIDEVVRVLRSDFLTQGPAVPKFEKSVRDYCSVDFAVATCNATAALHCACLALGVSAGDEVWVSAISFVASANCARYCGAKVHFVDVNPGTGNISAETLEYDLKQAAKEARIPKVLIVVHLAGQSCDMQAISLLCRQYDVAIVEDACHALGGRYQGLAIGGCQFSDITIFSFHPVKPITSGEGGMLVTNNEKLAERARLFACHGIAKEPHLWQDAIEAEGQPGWYYEQQVLGFNYRLSDIHAALGTSQLTRLDKQVRYRRVLAEYYDRLFASGRLCMPLDRHQECASAFHLYIVRFKSASVRNRIYDALRQAGYGVNLHYRPIPEQPYYQRISTEKRLLPGAKQYAETALSLPLFQGMERQQLDQVVQIIEQAMAGL
ncbi:MAG: UDP-4-amino-4,6-dideoxy-N-acetyl-beta-L-altrosamine transaminase [Gammaproteobacteria bacterium]|nr:MAG: UDP-4-amino-4,6-dideoxy-N-acetyl-beta-L-altrosamine transaminase [Gammaproteobacteria bacterium]